MGQVRGRGFHRPVPAMMVIVVVVVLVVMGAPVAGGNCVGAVFVAMGNC